MAASVRVRDIHVNGIDLHVLDAGEGPLVVLTHGWPELAYSWRHQIPVLADAGYRVVAPDMRGYGRSSRPEAIEDYDIFHLTGDLVALLDHEGEDQATFIGHDWGSIVVWQMALLHRERVRGVMGMSVPFVPRAPAPPTEIFRQLFGDSFFYILYFQEPGVADADLGADVATTMRRLLSGARGDAQGLIADDSDAGFVARLAEPEQLPHWLSQEELDHYVAEFTRTGFTGGVNWYRNFDRNWELTPHLAGATVDVPSAFLGGALDPVLSLSPPDQHVDLLTDFRGSTIVPDAGHWVQQEAPDAVNDAILDFLRSVHDT